TEHGRRSGIVGGWGGGAATVHRADWTLLPEGGFSALWRRLRTVGIPGAWTRPATCMVDAPATARRGGDRAVHTRPCGLDGNVYRIYSGRRSRSGSVDGRNLSTVFLLRCVAGSDAISVTTVELDGGVSGFGQRLCSCADGWSNGPTWHRRSAGLASLGYL